MSHRGKTKDQPRACVVIEPPAHLPEQVRAVWLAEAPEFAARGLLTETDVQAFEGYCSALANFRIADAMCFERGQTVTSVTAYGVVEKPAPWFTGRNRLSVELQQWIGVFGKSPRSRAQLGLPLGQPDQGDGFDEDETKKAAPKKRNR